MTCYAVRGNRLRHPERVGVAAVDTAGGRAPTTCLRPRYSKWSASHVLCRCLCRDAPRASSRQRRRRAAGRARRGERVRHASCVGHAGERARGKQRVRFRAPLCAAHIERRAGDRVGGRFASFDSRLRCSHVRCAGRRRQRLGGWRERLRTGRRAARRVFSRSSRCSACISRSTSARHCRRLARASCSEPRAGRSRSRCCLISELLVSWAQ